VVFFVLVDVEVFQQVQRIIESDVLVIMMACTMMESTVEVADVSMMMTVTTSEFINKCTSLVAVQMAMPMCIMVVKVFAKSSHRNCFMMTVLDHLSFSLNLNKASKTRQRLQSLLSLVVSLPYSNFMGIRSLSRFGTPV
jgi:hypothetical protein